MKSEGNFKMSSYYLRHRRWVEVMFHSRLSVSVCKQDIDKSKIFQMKLGRQVACVRRMNRFDFGEDPNLDPDMRIF